MRGSSAYEQVDGCARWLWQWERSRRTLCRALSRNWGLIWEPSAGAATRADVAFPVAARSGTPHAPVSHVAIRAVTSFPVLLRTFEFFTDLAPAVFSSISRTYWHLRFPMLPTELSSRADHIVPIDTLSRSLDPIIFLHVPPDGCRNVEAFALRSPRFTL